jgi:hypothetical protein
MDDNWTDGTVEDVQDPLRQARSPRRVSWQLPTPLHGCSVMKLKPMPSSSDLHEYATFRIASFEIPREARSRCAGLFVRGSTSSLPGRPGGTGTWRNWGTPRYGGRTVSGCGGPLNMPPGGSSEAIGMAVGACSGARFNAC